MKWYRIVLTTDWGTEFGLWVEAWTENEARDRAKKLSGLSIVSSREVKDEHL
jgi:hypothetical protein